jgi:hypothetical protein
MANCTFYTNCATGGDGGDGGNSGNHDASPGGGGGSGGTAYGGAIFEDGVLSSCTPTSSTIKGNRANGGQLGRGGQGTPSGSPGSIGSGRGGGVFSTGSDHFENTIIAGNFATDPSADLCVPSSMSGGYNLIGDSTGANWLLATGDQLDRDPMLAPDLGDNGGPTPTLALLPGSPAIDKGFAGLAIDQRGFSRPYDYDNLIYPNTADGSDIGAFELQPESDVVAYLSMSLPPGYSLLANPLFLPDNRVTQLFSGVSSNGFSIFKVDRNGLTANNYLNGQWSVPDMTLSPGEAWFFKNPYATTYSVLLVGYGPLGLSVESLPAGVSACSCPLPAMGGLQADLKYPVPSAGALGVSLWNGTGWDEYSYSGGSWTPGEPVIPLCSSFCVNNNHGVDWILEVDSFGNLIPHAGVPTTRTAWPSHDGQLNFFTYNPFAPTLHKVCGTGGGSDPLNSDYLGQLYGGTSSQPGTFTPLGTPVPFLSGAAAGYICSGAVSVPGTTAGQTVYAQLRCWKASDGATAFNSFKDAMDAGKAIGVSTVMTLTNGGTGGSLPVVPPSDVNTFIGFQLQEQNQWTSPGNGKWEDDLSWSLGMAPSINDPAEYIANAGSKTITNDNATATSCPDCMTVNNIVLGSPGNGDVNTLWLTNTLMPLHVLYKLDVLLGGNLQVRDGSQLLVDGDHTFQVDGTAAFNNASLTAANVEIARAGPGNCTLSGGTAQIGQLWIGYGDVGRLTNNGATLIVSNLVLGGLRGSDGTLMMQGGSISSSNGLTVTVGQGGAGTFILNGGTVTATQVLLTNGPNSVLQLAGGVLNSSNVIISSGAILAGNGTITGAVVNAGTILASGTALTFTGPFTNNGTILAKDGALISFADPVVNNGIIQFSDGRARFSSTFQNNGTVLPPLPRPGCALSFDGINDYVCVPGFLTNAPTSEVTVEFWGKANVVAPQAAFCMSAFINGSVFAAYVPNGYEGNGTVEWDFGNTNAGGRLTCDLTNSIVGAWQHFAFVASQINNCMRIYMNGALVASKTNMTPLLHASADLCLGGCAGVPFNGLLDEFRIWSVARSQADIQSTMHGSLTGFEPGLVAYWPMNECSGTNVYDAASPSAYTGTVFNGASWTNSDIPFMPSVLTLPPTSLGTNNATLAAAFDPNGLMTTAWFQWGTSTNYESATPATYLGSSSPALVTNITISGLVPGVTYYYRAVGSNIAGVNYGANFSLAIPVVPAPLFLIIAPTGTNVTLSWPIDGLYFALEQTRDLRTNNWTTANVLSVVVGTNITIMCPLGPSNVFYRLRKF